MRLTPARRHALLILGIQEDKRGWVRQGLLRQCGVLKGTLAWLDNEGLAECDPVQDTFEPYNWRWRLTAAGERKATALRVERDRATAAAGKK